MSESTSGSGGNNGGLYFIVGALVVVVGVLGFLFFGGDVGGPKDAKLDITINAPKTSP